jgi:hypothetical protein
MALLFPALLQVNPMPTRLVAEISSMLSILVVC